MANQVRKRFGSTLHFSPSRGAKEFFLVVSFTSASFPLSEDSVGLALQCCIGGDHVGFNVFKLSDRWFQFFLASSKVGHFIYGIKDQIWPDFVCHFSLFRGELHSVSKIHSDGAWFSSKQDLSIAQRSPTLFRPNLNFLNISASSDPSLSASELAKFGFVDLPATNSGLDCHNIKFGSFSPPPMITPAAVSSPPVKGDVILFGSFSDPISLDPDNSVQTSSSIGMQSSMIKFGMFSTPTVTVNHDHYKGIYYSQDFVRNVCSRLSSY